MKSFEEKKGNRSSSNEPIMKGNTSQIGLNFGFDLNQNDSIFKCCAGRRIMVDGFGGLKARLKRKTLVQDLHNGCR